MADNINPLSESRGNRTGGVAHGQFDRACAENRRLSLRACPGRGGDGRRRLSRARRRHANRHAVDADRLDFASSPGALVSRRGRINDALQQVVNIARIVAWITSAIAFITWLYRASKNLRPLGLRSPANSPGWAIGCWFVPIMNLIYPYYITAEICRERSPTDSAIAPDRWEDHPCLVRFWWGAHVLMGFYFFCVQKLPVNNLGEIVVQNQGMIAGNVLLLFVAALAILVVRRIDRNQEERYRLLASQPAPTPRAPQPASGRSVCVLKGTVKSARGKAIVRDETGKEIGRLRRVTSSASTWARPTRRCATSIRRKSRGRCARLPCRSWLRRGRSRPARRCRRSTISRPRAKLSPQGRGKAEGRKAETKRSPTLARRRLLRPRPRRAGAGPADQLGQVVAVPLGRGPHGGAAAVARGGRRASGSRRSRSAPATWPTSATPGTPGFPASRWPSRISCSRCRPRSTRSPAS